MTSDYQQTMSEGCIIEESLTIQLVSSYSTCILLHKRLPWWTYMFCLSLLILSTIVYIIKGYIPETANTNHA